VHTETVHVIDDRYITFDRGGYPTRTRCGIRFKKHPDTASVWPEDKKQGYVFAMGDHLTISRSTHWCSRCSAKRQFSNREEGK